MMIPEFMRFYHYTAEQVLNESARVFFSLMNSMYRLQANEQLSQILVQSTAFNCGSEAQSVILDLNKQAKGLHGILE